MMVDVLIISVDPKGGGGIVRLFLDGRTWLNELATLRTVIGRPVAMHAVTDREMPGARLRAWTTDSK